MSHTITTRFMLIANGGFGNPNQYPIFSSPSVPPAGLVIPTGNFDLSAINVNGGNENFVIFARSTTGFINEVPGFNIGDLINIFEFIYETLLKRCFSNDNRSCDLKLEIDFSGYPGLVDMLKTTPWISPNHLDMAFTPMARAFFSEMNRSYQMIGSMKNLSMHYIEYNSDECRALFFPECEGKCHCGRKPSHLSISNEIGDILRSVLRRNSYTADDICRLRQLRELTRDCH